MRKPDAYVREIRARQLQSAWSILSTVRLSRAQPDRSLSCSAMGISDMYDPMGGSEPLVAVPLYARHRLSPARLSDHARSGSIPRRIREKRSRRAIPHLALGILRKLGIHGRPSAQQRLHP